MIPRIWRLSENVGTDNLGLACTEQGLVLGRTPLIERRDGRFVVREQNELECLFSLAYGREATAQRLMPGLATVAAALDAKDQGLARIAAVHLRIPDLPDRAARDVMEAADVLIKYARDEGGGDWNATQHPRTGTPPNPGWFAPTGGSSDGSSSPRSAESVAVMNFWDYLFGRWKDLITEGGGGGTGSGRGPGKAPPVEPQPPRVEPKLQGETRSLESILAPDGELIGNRGTRDTIRVVSPDEFEVLRSDLLSVPDQSRVRKTMTAWYLSVRTDH
jgi:hypothetical protein